MFVCKTLDPVTVQCLEWTEQTFVPYLSASDRNEILIFAVSCFALVFAVKQILRMF